MAEAKQKPGPKPKEKKAEKPEVLITMYHQNNSIIQITESEVDAHLAGGWTHAPK